MLQWKRYDISEMSHVFKAVVVRIIKYSSLAQETWAIQFFLSHQLRKFDCVPPIIYFIKVTCYMSMSTPQSFSLLNLHAPYHRVLHQCSWIDWPNELMIMNRKWCLKSWISIGEFIYRDICWQFSSLKYLVPFHQDIFNNWSRIVEYNKHQCDRHDCFCLFVLHFTFCQFKAQWSILMITYS